MDVTDLLEVVFPRKNETFNTADWVTTFTKYTCRYFCNISMLCSLAMPIVLYHLKIINIIFIHVRFITSASDVILNICGFVRRFTISKFSECQFAETMRTVKREIYTESAMKWCGAFPTLPWCCTSMGNDLLYIVLQSYTNGVQGFNSFTRAFIGKNSEEDSMVFAIFRLFGST